LAALVAMAQAITAQDRKYKADLPPAIPEDVWAMLVPEDNPMTEAKVALGRDLYFDKRLSIDNTVSCATCHDPKSAFAEPKQFAEGVGGKRGARNSPTVFNAMFNVEQFWDGRAATLEEQAKGPIINPLEMAMTSHDLVIERLKKDAAYVKRFQEVFGGPPTIGDVAKAIASFERTLVSADSPFDRFQAADAGAMSEQAKRGFELFKGKGRCITCHEFNASSPFFTDFKYHNIGVGMKATANFEGLARKVQQMAQEGKLSAESIDTLSLTEGFSELGRFIVTRQPKDLGAFKTPTLRNVELTAPYMHDGSQKTLREVIDFYNKGGEPNPNLDGGMRALELTDQEINDLIEFLNALTGDRARRLSRGEEVIGPSKP
jgi:cytochrome c peroxidase